MRARERELGSKRREIMGGEDEREKSERLSLQACTTI